MATATLLHPSTTHTPQPSYSSYPPSGSNMATSTDSRRPAEDSDPSKRHSLPPISEVLSAKSNQYPQPAPSNIPPSTAFPSPFGAGPPRPYGEPEKHPSPQTHRAPASYPPGREPLSSFADSPRTSFSGRPGLPPVAADRRPSPSNKPDGPPHRYPHDAQKDHRSLNGAYPHPPVPSASTSASSYSTGPLPHGQMPLPSYPTSPRHAPPHTPHTYASSYDQRGPPRHVEDGDRGMRPPYEATVYSAPWNYGESLGQVSAKSSAVSPLGHAD
jgi:hypothetical protein